MRTPIDTGTLHPHRGWHSRGYVPHFDYPDAIQFITFSLHDAVAAETRNQWCDTPAADRAAMNERIATEEDQGFGSCWLRQPPLARLVEDALLFFDAQRYRLLAWCIMPNHVHVVAHTIVGNPLGRIVHSWKSFTSSEANRRLSRSGAFWYPDYYDRFIRDQKQLTATIAYVEGNPVKAGFVTTAAAWPYSSARFRG